MEQYKGLISRKLYCNKGNKPNTIGELIFISISNVKMGNGLYTVSTYFHIFLHFFYIYHNYLLTMINEVVFQS